MSFYVESLREKAYTQMFLCQTILHIYPKYSIVAKPASFCYILFWYDQRHAGVGAAIQNREPVWFRHTPSTQHALDLATILFQEFFILVPWESSLWNKPSDLYTAIQWVNRMH